MPACKVRKLKLHGPLFSFALLGNCIHALPQRHIFLDPGNEREAVGVGFRIWKAAPFVAVAVEVVLLVAVAGIGTVSALTGHFLLANMTGMKEAADRAGMVEL